MTDGVVDIDFTISGCQHGILTKDPCFCPFILGDSPSDLLDNSIIGSNLSTFTTGSTALVGGVRTASLGGLRTKAQGLHGISTVELWDYRLWISLDAANMESVRLLPAHALRGLEHSFLESRPERKEEISEVIFFLLY